MTNPFARSLRKTRERLGSARLRLARRVSAARDRARGARAWAAERTGITPGGALLSAVILLVTVGTVMVFSASFFHQSVGGDPFHFLRRHLFALPLAILCGALAARLDYHVLSRWYLPVLGVTVVLLALVFIPGIGMELSKARRWIRAGGEQFQPSELAKAAVVLFVARFLVSDPRRAFLFWKGFLPACAAIFAVAGLILMSPDFGTAMFVLILSGTLLVIAGMRKRYALLSVFLAAPPVTAFVLWRWEKIKPRLLAFIEPERIYQVKQSLIALGAGGIGGAGLGASSQKLKFLPEPQTDFIFAIVGEELGFAGSVLVVLLFVALLLSGAAIARRARDTFGFLLASGIVIALSLQAAINIAVVTATGPTKGIPLPFITFGGSGLVMTLIEVGLLLSVDRSSRAAGPVFSPGSGTVPQEAPA